MHALQSQNVQIPGGQVEQGLRDLTLRTYGRVLATLSGALGGRGWSEIWQDSTGFTRKVGLYLRYPILGAEMLQVAESDPWVIAWAREYHEPEEDWTVPVEVFRVVAAADR